MIKYLLLVLLLSSCLPQEPVAPMPAPQLNILIMHPKTIESVTEVCHKNDGLLSSTISSWDSSKVVVKVSCKDGAHFEYQVEWKNE